MRKIKNIEKYQIEKQRPKNEVTRLFEDILANRTHEDEIIKQNRNNYLNKYGQDF